MKNYFMMALLGATLAISLAAQAEQSYVKANIGSSVYKNSDGKFDETAVSLAYGFKVDENFGVEGGVIDFGQGEQRGLRYSNTTERRAIYLAGVSTIPLQDKLSAFGKLGIAVNQYENRFVTTVSNEIEKTTRTRPMMGLGLAYKFTKEIDGTVEYQYFGKVGEDRLEVSTMTAGVKYNF